MRRPAVGAVTAALAAAALLAAAAGPALALTQRTSLAAIEPQVMCVTCGIPLAEADSPAAQDEKAAIQQLVTEGRTASEIKAYLVAQYGNAVLALPPDSGFNVVVYVVPIAAVVAAPLVAKPGDALGADQPPITVFAAASLREETPA